MPTGEKPQVPGLKDVEKLNNIASTILGKIAGIQEIASKIDEATELSIKAIIVERMAALAAIHSASNFDKGYTVGSTDIG